MKVSIVIPAHNEEKYIGKCLESIKKAEEKYDGEVEIIVVINRCTDMTQEIACSYGAVIVEENSKNISKIRNAGVKHSTGDILLTIDADSFMTENLIVEIMDRLMTGKYVGGGIKLRFERVSLGIILSCLVLFPIILIKEGKPVGGGAMWCYKEYFDAIGGFNEELLSAEDIDFGKRLMAYGKRIGKKYGIIYKSQVITSCRKFDKFGDWYILRNPKRLLSLMKGKDKESTEKIFYDVER